MKMKFLDVVKNGKVILFVFSFIIISAAAAPAEEKTQGPFNTDTQYDVYFASPEGTLNLIRNVKVLEPVTIQEVTFFVIQTANIKSDKGYIMMEYVVAIIPIGQIVDSR